MQTTGGYSAHQDGNKLPVFVFPTSLVIYADDQTSHKQILTLYNPYEFPLKFSVLCTSPRKYAVVDPKGIIKSACCVDILIRHNAVSPSNYESVDKFRIQIREHGSRAVFGKKDIPVTLHASKQHHGSGGAGGVSGAAVGLRGVAGGPVGETADSEHFQQLASSNLPLNVHTREYAFASGTRTALSNNNASSNNSSSNGPSLVVVLAGIVSLIALALPTEGQNDARLPPYLHLSVHQKLVAAFTLGLVAMSILKS